MGFVADEPGLPDYPDRTPAFRRLMRDWGVSGEGQKRVHEMESQATDAARARSQCRSFGRRGASWPGVQACDPCDSMICDTRPRR